MNNSLDRVFEDIIRLLRDDVIPQLEGDALRSQTFGAIFMLKNLQLRVDWSCEPLLGEVRAQDELFDRLREMQGVAWSALPSGPRVGPDAPSGAQLMVLRDEGNALVSRLIAEPVTTNAAQERQASSAIALLLQTYVRAELDMEMRHTPKPMFAEMSSGKSPNA